MPMYRQESIDEVRDATDIVDLISEYVTLKRSGKNFMGLCPFHSEKTPSFSVNREKRMYHCFGCQAGGDAIAFLMEHEGLDFVDALEKLADRAGILLETDDSRPAGAKPRRNTRALEINLEAARFFYASFNQEAGAPAVAYLLDRQVEPEIRKKFKLGFAPDSWDQILKHFETKGVFAADLEEAGLALRREDGSAYARFRNRLMFPIENTKGEIIGFGGRVIGPGEPKYLNSPESPVFQKKSNLYALNLALPEIRRTSRVLLMEGYMDVIMSHQHGFTNAVASLGTAFTPEQARLIKKYAGEVILVYDGDQAGRKATRRAIETFSGMDLLVRVANLRGAKDPDDFIRENGTEAFGEILKKALPAYEHLLRVGKSSCNPDSIEDRVHLTGELIPLLASMENQIKQTEYLRLTARELDLSEESLAFEIRKFRENQFDGQRRQEIRVRKQKESRAAHDPAEKGELELLSICLRNPAVFQAVEEQLKDVELENPLVLVTLEKMAADTIEETRRVQTILDSTPETDRRKLVALCMSERCPDDEVTARAWIRFLKREKLKKEIETERRKIEFAEKEGNLQDLIEIQKRIKTLQSDLNRI